jgi:hypothetical protein
MRLGGHNFQRYLCDIHVNPRHGKTPLLTRFGSHRLLCHILTDTEALYYRTLLFYNRSTKVSLSHLRTTTTSFRTTGLSRMQRAKNQLVLMLQLGLTQLGIPSLFRAQTICGNPLTMYHL